LIIQEANYVKYNRSFYKDRERREAGKKVLLEFFRVNERVMNGLTGFLIIDNETDFKERIVLIFWKSKESMTAFHSEENNVLISLVNKLKPLLSEMPVRFDYKVTSFKTM
jgi:heme-degrading monooxygenase HmoA